MYIKQSTLYCIVTTRAYYDLNGTKVIIFQHCKQLYKINIVTINSINNCDLIIMYSYTYYVQSMCYNIVFFFRFRQNGDSWKVDECKSCLCVRGQVQCAQELCPSISTSCPANMKLRTMPGSCCPQCVPSEFNAILLYLNDTNALLQFASRCFYANRQG